MCLLMQAVNSFFSFFLKLKSTVGWLELCGLQPPSKYFNYRTTIYLFSISYHPNSSMLILHAHMLQNKITACHPLPNLEQLSDQSIHEASGKAQVDAETIWNLSGSKRPVSSGRTTMNLDVPETREKGRERGVRASPPPSISRAVK